MYQAVHAILSTLLVLALGSPLCAQQREGRSTALRFAPRAEWDSARNGFGPHGVEVSASVEVLNGTVRADLEEELCFRLRLHWRDARISAINPFMTPHGTPVAQVAVFDENHDYVGNLTGWRAGNPWPMAEEAHDPPITVLPGRRKSQGRTGRTVRARPRVQVADELEKKPLPVGEYTAQLVVYSSIFPESTKAYSEVCRSAVVPFRVVAVKDSVSIDNATPAKNGNSPLECRFIPDPLAIEIENVSPDFQWVFEPFLSRAPYQPAFPGGTMWFFDWSSADGALSIDARHSLLRPSPHDWYPLPPGAFVGVEGDIVSVPPTMKDRAGVETALVIQRPVLRNYAFPDSEAPWQFKADQQELCRSNRLQLIDGKWAACSSDKTN